MGCCSGYGPGALHLHRNSGSVASFTSIDTVTDFGFTRQTNSRNTTELNETCHQEKKWSHLEDSRRDQNRTDASSTPSNETETDFANVLSKRFWSLRTESRNSKDESDQKHFYPIDRIQELLAPRNVRETLRTKIPDLSKDESEAMLERLTQAVCGAPKGTLNEGQPQQAPRQRLFALLLLVEKIECIGCFAKCGVNDLDLPLHTSSDLKLYPKHDTAHNNPLECFRGWKTIDIEWFITHQYRVLSPFFDLDPRNTCLYFLPSGILLPFVEYEEACEGGQGSVKKVLIHPAHHNLAGGDV